MCDQNDDIESHIPLLIANLRARHPELVGGLDDETIRRRFCCFHDEHDMRPESLRSHLHGERELPSAA